jgi:uncharacterized damage-inducible protein DinB
MDTTLHRLLAHDAWTTRQLLLACRDLPDADLDRSFDMGPGSLRATFDHVIGTMESWADRIGDRPKRRREPGAPSASVDDMLVRLDDAAADLRETAERVCAEGRLEEVMELTYEGTLYRFTRGIALVHVTTHGMHHRAQIINMLRQLGVAHEIEGDAITWELEMKVVPQAV